MNNNLKIIFGVFCAFVLSLTMFSFYMEFYESGVLYNTNWLENFNLTESFNDDQQPINPKHVSIEFLKRIFGG